VIIDKRTHYGLCRLDQESERADASLGKGSQIRQEGVRSLRYGGWTFSLVTGHPLRKIMAVSGRKTMNVFKRYNLVTEAELSNVTWHDRAESLGG